MAIQLEVNDLKTKVLRLTEQVTEHAAKVNFFSVMSEQVNLMDRQIQRWRYRLPDQTDDESQESVVSAVEVQEELNKFQDLRLNSMVGDSVGTLSDRFTDLEQTVQSRRTAPGDRR